jgi:hypothetical protein
MEAPVEIRYAGVVVASATEILRAPGNDSGMFLVTPEPLPVGTAVDLAGGRRGRVEKVVESPDPRGAGMYVRLLSGDEAAAPWVPQLPEMIPLPAPRRVPTPPGIPLVSPRVAEARPTLGENGERRATIHGPVPPPVAPERPASIVLANPERPATTATTSPADTSPPPVAPLVDPREPRKTIVMAVPPPGSDLDAPGAGGRASGEFQSRAPASAAAPRDEVQAAPASIVIAADDDDEPRDENMVQAPLVTAPSEEGPSGENRGSPDELLQPARPLPPPDGRRKTARRRRNTR